jgi:hypothetical protein
MNYKRSGIDRLKRRTFFIHWYLNQYGYEWEQRVEIMKREGVGEFEQTHERKKAWNEYSKTK